MSDQIPTNVVSQNGQGVFTDAQANTWVQTDQTAAQLRGFVGITGMAVLLQGLTGPSDGAGGVFYWSAGNYTDDGRTVIVPPAATNQGAWLRSNSMFGVPSYTVTALPAVTASNQGQMAYATNARNTGEGVGAGTGCLLTVNSAGIWASVWSGLAPTV